MLPVAVLGFVAVCHHSGQQAFLTLRKRAALGSMICAVCAVLACSGKSQGPAQPGAAGSGAAGMADAGMAEAGMSEVGAAAGTDAGEGPAPNGGAANGTLTALAFVPAQSTLVLGTHSSLVVMGTYSNGMKQDLTRLALFISSNPSVAAVSSRGVTAEAVGKATITASVATLSTTAEITVEAQRVTALTVATPMPSLTSDGGTQLRALASMNDGTMKDVTMLAVWTSADAKIARLIQSGFVVAMGRGSVTITAKWAGLEASLEETVTGDALTSYSIGGTRVLRSSDQGKLELHAHFASNRDVIERDARFQTSAGDVLTVTDMGELRAVGPGTARVDALLGTSVAASIDVVVTAATLEAIQVVGQTPYEFCNPPQVRAIGTFSDGTSYDVTALVDGGEFEAGLDLRGFGTDTMRLIPTALGPRELELDVGEVRGSAVFTAVLGSPASITLDDAVRVPVGAFAVLGAVAHCADQGPTVDVTSSVQWQSEEPSIVSIGPAAADLEAQGVQVGTTRIHATYPGFTIQPLTVTVFDATPVVLELEPADGNLVASSSFPMQVYGRYADESRYRLTSACAWSTNDSTVASVSNTSGSVGKLTTAGGGAVIVTAHCGALSVSASFEVL